MSDILDDDGVRVSLFSYYMISNITYIILGEDVIQILLAVGEYAIPVCCQAADAVRYGPMRSDVVHCGPAPML